MTTVRQALAKWESFDRIATGGQAMTTVEQPLLQLNKDQLYNEGKDRNGDLLQFYKLTSYSTTKNNMNPRPGYGVPDLFYTGQFHSKFYMNIVGDSYIIGSSDSKSNALSIKYGEAIFGFSASNKVKAWNQYIRLKFVELLAIHTGAGWH